MAAILRVCVCSIVFVCVAVCIAVCWVFVCLYVVVCDGTCVSVCREVCVNAPRSWYVLGCRSAWAYMLMCVGVQVSVS